MSLAILKLCYEMVAYLVFICYANLINVIWLRTQELPYLIRQIGLSRPVFCLQKWPVPKASEGGARISVMDRDGIARPQKKFLPKLHLGVSSCAEAWEFIYTPF